MLSINFIRNNPKKIKDAVSKKHMKLDVDRLLEVDEKRREYIQKIEELQAEKNKLGKEKREKAKEIKKEIKKLKPKLDNINEKYKKLMLQVPNIPDDSVPKGEDDSDNKEIKKVGEKPDFDFKPKSHIELLKLLNLADLERGSKVSGFRGYFLKNEAVLMVMALWKLAIGALLDKDFEIFEAPALVKEDGFLGTGWLPLNKKEVYKIEGEDLYLAGTAEVPMMAYRQNEILDSDDLPIKMAAISSCYRSEAGSYGKDTKGIYRLHEFRKIEQVILCKSDHEESVKWHENITKNSEELMQKLELPYRVVANCGGDLGQGQVKKYDIEAWIPTQNRYGETHSSSYFHDFQTRRLKIRYRDENDEIKYVHSLNNTAIATPRILIQILENNQQKDGSIIIPKVLRKYMGGQKLITPKK